jgi:hypothetical protein
MNSSRLNSTFPGHGLVQERQTGSSARYVSAEAACESLHKASPRKRRLHRQEARIASYLVDK